MNEAKKNSVNRCFPAHKAQKQREEEIKRLLNEAHERKNAEK